MTKDKKTDLVKSDNKLTKKPYSTEQIKLIARTVAKGATEDELKLFLIVANKAGLDPFSKQIHYVKRKTKEGFVGAIQTGIDGYRAIAERTKQYAGSDDIVYDKEDGTPGKATSTVYRIVKGVRVAFTATARWKEYCPPAPMDFMWKKMPYLMLGKVAESLALRKAFPNDLSGIYVEEEMESVGKVITDPAQVTIPSPSPAPAEAEVLPKVKSTALSNLYATAREFGATEGMEDVFIQERLAINVDWSEMTDADLARLRTQLMSKLTTKGK